MSRMDDNTTLKKSFDQSRHACATASNQLMSNSNVGSLTAPPPPYSVGPIQPVPLGTPPPPYSFLADSAQPHAVQITWGQYLYNNLARTVRQIFGVPQPIVVEDHELEVFRVFTV
ncbi:hypothetical protein C8R44DRAFT_882815 [Mycena epipterygia]|nr:hypothetical protein C8R44DRAFT_882815 [Mycena epipterygia]